MLEFLTTFLYIAEIIIGLGLLIFIHELGHFLMAKRNKVRVETFSLGFGPAIWKKKKGDTEYRISWIPLGGYVKMAGESIGDERSGKDDELTSKTGWQRLQIFAAGAIMNLLIAFPICILAFLLGKYEMSPEVAVPGKPETYAGMLPGDVIVKVDDVEIESGDHYRIEMVRREKGSIVPVTIRRGGKEILLKVEQEGSESHRTMPLSTRFPKITADSALAKAGLESGDEILALNGEKVYSGQRLREVLRENGGKEVALQVRRRPEDSIEGEIFDVSVTLPGKEAKRFPEDARMIEPIIGMVSEGDPASGQLEEGDVILRIEGFHEDLWTKLRRKLRAEEPERAARLYRKRDGKQVFGIEVLSWQDLKDVVEPSVGVGLTFEVKRGEESHWLKIMPTFSQLGRGKIGVMYELSRKIAEVTQASPSPYGGKIKSGDELISFDGTPGDISIARDIFGHVFKGDVESVSMVVRRGEEKVELELKPESYTECDFEKLGISDSSGRLFLDYARIFRKRSVGQAFKDGMKEPVNIGILTFQLLYKLVKTEESTKGLAGPVGIFKVSYESARLAPGNLLWLLALITVNLGIFNLLPIPVLDGGHIVLLAIEKIRGKAPSEKFVAIFQYIGLVFLLALIVFVTYNDINRLL